MTTQKERFRPKWENLQRLLDRGVIPYTIWNFEGKQECDECHKKRAVLYPDSSGFSICCDCWRRAGLR
jgi:hypothetical protein